MSSQPPDDSIADYRHDETRTALPYAALSDRTRVKEAKKKEWEYDPHLPPVLRWDEKATAERILQKAAHSALDAEELNNLSRLLEQQQPWLEWTSKREKPAATIEPVALHLHERVSTHAILKMAARQDVARNLFADPEEDYREAVKAYEHEVQWANRLILGDSLQGMTSLVQRENLAGKVQCIYFDPPYGIKFASNFQSEVGKRNVKDRDEDLTREPEVVKAYRDTWTLGVHSYLTYLRDRLHAAKELLTDSGSIFVQISDENLHRVRILMDEVFGVENFVNLITIS